MSGVPSPRFRITAALPATLAAALLAACRREVPAPPTPPAEPAPRVAPSTDLRGASDHPDAPPAVGALTANQDAGGASARPMQPSAGDGRAASAASSPR